MCIAVYIPKNVTIKNEYLYNCFKNNNDGAGFAYIENDKIKIDKGFFGFKYFLSEFKKVRKKVMKESPFMLHFRIATYGKVNCSNCHPFPVRKNLIFCHNGTIKPDGVEIRDEMSDTKQFRDDILAKLPEDFIEHAGVLELVKNYIKRSKLIFMDDLGRITIVNEQLGEWCEGMWFSNNSYSYEKKKFKTTFYYGRDYVSTTGKSEKTNTVSTVVTTKKETNTTTTFSQKDLYCKFCDSFLCFSEELKRNLCNSCYRCLKKNNGNKKALLKKLKKKAKETKQLTDI